jgi:hypothetical protein
LHRLRLSHAAVVVSLKAELAELLIELSLVDHCLAGLAALTSISSID